MVLSLRGFTEAKVTASLCRKSYADFVRTFWPVVNPGDPLVWNWHMQLMCDKIQASFERIFRGDPNPADLVINIPPGTSKSTICSVMSLPWAWTRMVNFCMIGASYAHPLALNLSRLSRDVVRSELYQTVFPGIILRDDLDTKSIFGNTRGGVRYAVGSEGSITGFHGHVIVIDDPLDPNRAVSEIDRFNINDWIKQTLSSRKKDKRVTVMITVMQRLHQDDPSAQRVAEGNCDHVCLPGDLEFKVHPPELAENYTNGLLDPVRLSRDALDKERQRLGEAGYAGQYGQDPVPAGGGLFKTDMIRWGRPPEKFKAVVRFWDKAATADAREVRKAAYTTGVKMALAEDESLWVLDVKRVRLDTFAREKLIRDTAQADGRSKCVIGLEQEPGSGGKDSVVLSIRRLRGFRVRVLIARRDKTLRAEEFSVQLNAGQVWIPQQYRRGSSWQGWAATYVDELRHWPTSTYLDQGDASSGAFTLLARPVRRCGPIRQKKSTTAEKV